ncbi:MAG: response regulator [Anaerolineales bacterium]|jgi:DNA-binding response OmpR family regulator
MEDKNLILIIEDDLEIMTLLRQLAELEGYEAEVILDGAVAMKRLDVEPIPNLVLLDLHLPNVEGDVVLRAARANPGWMKVPLYIITVDPQAAQPYRMQRSGNPRVDGVLVKGDYMVGELPKLLKRYAK